MNKSEFFIFRVIALSRLNVWSCQDDTKDRQFHLLVHLQVSPIFGFEGHFRSYRYSFNGKNRFSRYRDHDWSWRFPLFLWIFLQFIKTHWFFSKWKCRDVLIRILFILLHDQRTRRGLLFMWGQCPLRHQLFLVCSETMQGSQVAENMFCFYGYQCPNIFLSNIPFSRWTWASTTESMDLADISEFDEWLDDDRGRLNAVLAARIPLPWSRASCSKCRPCRSCWCQLVFAASLRETRNWDAAEKECSKCRFPRLEWTMWH